MFEYYKTRIELLHTFDEIEAEIDEIANCDELTNEEYTELVTIATNKFRN